jgi:hypothetical protein
MSTQLIDFETGSLTTGDSGERMEEESIKPYVAGERVQAVVFDRPLENLRARTEELRKKVEDLLYRADADKWIITGGNSIGQVTVPVLTAFPTVTWSTGTNKFTISEAIVLQPLMAPLEDKFASKSFVLKTATFLISANDNVAARDILFDYQLANSIRIIWEESASLGGDTCVATIEGEPEHILRIVIRDDGTTLASDVAVELNTILGPPIAASPFKFTLTSAVPVYISLSDLSAGDRDVVLTGTYSRELHHLAAAELNTFFGTTTLSADGDGIGIWYEELTDSVLSTRGGRRQATPLTDTAPNTEVTASKLFKFSTNPEKIPGAIPLCRRIGTSLVFVDGTVVSAGQTATFGGEGSIDALLARYLTHVGGTADKHTAGVVTSTPYSWIAATDVGAVINEIVDDLADATTAADGASKVGLYQIAGTPESIGNTTTRAAINAIYGHLNARTERATLERVTQPWDIGQDTGGVEDDTRMRLRGSILMGTIAGGSWGKYIDLVDIASRLHPGAYSLASPVIASNQFITADFMLPKAIAGTALVVRDSAVLSSKQRRLICSIDADVGGAGTGNAGVAYLWDPHDTVTGTVATATLGSLPTGGGRTWKAAACCSNGTTLFVLFQAVNFAPSLVEWRVQAYDATSNSLPKIAAWPSTGIDPTVGFTGPIGAGFGVIRTVNICMASATKVVTCNGWIELDIASRPAISVFNASDGGSLASGDGGVTPGAGWMPSGGICSDGTTIYWTSQLGNAAFTAVLNSSRISTPNTNGSGWTNIALGNASGATANRCHSLCWDGEAIWCPLENGEIITASTIYKSAASVSYAAHTSIDFLGACCFDGLRVWILGHGLALNGIVAVGIDASLAHPIVGGLAISDLSPRLVSLLRGIESVTTPPDCTDYGTLLFDGDAVWCTLNDKKGSAGVNMLGYTRAIRASSRR